MSRQKQREYFTWLTSQIDIPDRNPNTYNDLFVRMYDTEFVWIVPHDDNRVQDGADLRVEFFGSRRDILTSPISVLEVLVALSRRVAFIAGGDARFWAWNLLENLKLNKASDPLTGRKAEKVEEILETLIFRTYDRNGNGSFFPLRNAQDDQTKMEIWFQMQLYVMEIEQL